MLGTLELQLIVAFTLLVVCLTGIGRFELAVAACFVGTLTYRRIVLGYVEAPPGRVGIAGPNPWLTTELVGVLCVVLLTASRSRLVPWRRILPIAAYLPLWYGLFWPHLPNIHAGVIHIWSACLAFLAGSLLAIHAHAHERAARVVSLWVLAWSGLQAAVSAVQAAGSPIFRNSSFVEDPTLAFRMSGTLGHPSSIGKAIFLVLMIALPYLWSTDKVVRNRILAAIALAAVPLAFSQARANIAAVVALVALASMFDPSRNRWRNRFGAIALLGSIGLATSGIWFDRFASDESGYRLQLFRGAWSYFERSARFVGTGPNAYQETVGQSDPFAAAGWPVHNIALLGAIELGVAGAALLFLPYIVTVIRAVGVRREPSLAGRQASVVLASVPGLLMIGMTGWGMLGDSLIPWFLTLGYCAATIERGRQSRNTQTPSGGSPAVRRNGHGRIAGARADSHHRLSMKGRGW